MLEFLYAHTTEAGVPGPVPLAAAFGGVLGNRAVQHIAMWDYFPQVRSGSRVTIKGDRPF